MSTTNPGPGQPAADDHAPAGTPPAEVIKRGYEEDHYDSRSVLSVPLLVVVFFALAFTTVTIMFAYFRHTPTDPTANPMAVEDNSRTLNERIAATPARGRPEPLKQLDDRGGYARAITRPALKEGNPPELHPEDIRPSPENTPTLFEAKWLPGNKFARVPLDDAKALALKDGKLLKAREGAAELPQSWQVPTGSNAGRGKPPAKPAKEGKH